MEINGLPLHPLAVHAAVVLAPIAALIALAYLVPRWRDRLRRPLLIASVVAVVVIVVAYLSGDSFLEANSFFQGDDKIEEHEELADLLLWVTFAFGALGVVTSWLHARAGAVRVSLNVLLAAAAVATLVLVFLTGEAGARAVWGSGYAG
ncbi:DUF2231 domain-containing protein [Nocardioides sp. R-C-SC26]|uniref:DUF2231 domain-containing protein n=1 Tax=Nocardioides sp. R-C-SC26 TaxID=2870414 RepID=UPI001E5AF78A|nr:DUF2231 domain-containing protein [Nocardioides sp. R-C-SC26]